MKEMTEEQHSQLVSEEPEPESAQNVRVLLRIRQMNNAEQIDPAHKERSYAISKEIKGLITVGT